MALTKSSQTDRQALAKACVSHDWSTAIRILNSLISHSPESVQDICNRAFCYSKLDLHKHVIKDCDKALELDPNNIQIHILKGRALAALGKDEDALHIWKQGYEEAQGLSVDFKLLMELQELMSSTTCDSPITSNGEQEEYLKVLSDSTSVSCSCKIPMNPVEELGPLQRRGVEDALPRKEIIDSFPNKSEPLQDDVTKDFDKDDDAKPLQKEGHLEPLGKESKLMQNEDVWKSMRKEPKLLQNKDDSNHIQKETKPLQDGDVLKPLQKDGKPLKKEVKTVKEEVSKSAKKESKSTKKEGKHLKEENLKTVKKEPKTSQKEDFLACLVSKKSRSISLDLRLSRGIAQVNEGNYDQAIAIFNQILKDNPTSAEALIGRGTAHAFERNLEAAIRDFSKAIQSNPTTGEAWKRRGQARAALGETIEAVEDLTKALDFEPKSSDILHERGMVYFKAKEFEDAVSDLHGCVQLERDNKSAYSYMGLALLSIGEYEKAFQAHEKALKLDRNFKEGWYHMAQSYQDLSEVEKAVECLDRVLYLDSGFVNGYRLLGLLKHGTGDHKGAIKDLSSGLIADKHNIECLYLRASCYHAIGEYGNAVKDYNAVLNLDIDSHEKFVLQCLTFYQKELALYLASKATANFSWFDIDNDIHPLFKESWCKRLHPKKVCEVVYRQPPVRESLKKCRVKKQDIMITKAKKPLLEAADHIGRKIQYSCPGFLKNKRQHRMAGMAAIEIAQKVSSTWRALRDSWISGENSETKGGKRNKKKERNNMISQNRGGACCSSASTSDSSPSCSCHEEKSSHGRLTLGWQEVYNIAVKWRQISEPCDPVVWVNKLGDEFKIGFGSHTPIILGQAKVVRYFPNFHRAFSIAKTLMLQRKEVYNSSNSSVDLSDPAKLRAIESAKSCSELYGIVNEDFWIVTSCNSTAFEGKTLEGTRLTVQKKGIKSYDFSIRTPCTPKRWAEYNSEMASAWETLCETCCRELYGFTDISRLEKVQDCILRISYYWYNFMPLARGTAVVGFVVLLGLLLAADMEFTGKIPEKIQVDWEAILSQDFPTFMQGIKQWLCPSLKIDTSWHTLPDVSSTFTTVASVVAALSSYDK